MTRRVIKLISCFPSKRPRFTPAMVVSNIFCLIQDPSAASSAVWKRTFNNSNRNTLAKKKKDFSLETSL